MVKIEEIMFTVNTAAAVRTGALNTEPLNTEHLPLLKHCTCIYYTASSTDEEGNLLSTSDTGVSLL